MFSFCLAFLLGTSFAVTKPTPLAELSTQRGALGSAHWAAQVVVQRDGRFSAGGRSGQLTPAELDALEAAIAAIPSADAEAERPTCRARPFAHVRLTTTRGTFIESTPCGRRFHPAVADVAAALDRLLTGPDLVRVEEASVEGGAWRVRVRIAPDGHFFGPGGEGALNAKDLAGLERALAATKLELAPPTEVLCAALPFTRYRVGIGDRHVSWYEPCGRVPDPSVPELTRLLDALTGGG